MHRIFKSLLFIIFFSPILFCQSFNSISGMTKSNFNFVIEQQSSSGLTINFSIEESLIKEVIKNKNPDLLQVSKYLAIPNGALPSVEIISSSQITFQNIDLVNHLVNTNNLVNILGTTKIRGMEAVMLELKPFKYYSASGKLVVFNKLKLSITFSGGDGSFGGYRLRNRWWDQIYSYVFLNHLSLPTMEYKFVADSIDDGYEYVIITPDNPDYLSWADSLRNFRTLQGINTGIVTLSEIGGNDATLIENFINEAYNTWVIPPAAILFLGDYGNGPSNGNGIISPVYNGYCVSDNIYGDVDEDELPDIIVSRITAQSVNELESIISKIINYEQTPPSFLDFYDHPLCVSGWSSTGAFVLCSEVIFGFYENVLNKVPFRQYSGYIGGPPTAWPTDAYSNSLLQIFGPNGLGYVPATPSYLTNWSGSSSGINDAINNGTFAIYYRGQGSETSWAEPVYTVSDLSGLNNFYPPFIASIAPLTGKFNYGNDCLAEAFLKHPDGAIGVIAATEITYSFVTSDYGWGLYDYLWPEFLPGVQTSLPYCGVMPAFANAAAKYFLQSNNSPYYNQQQKELTYHLFHYFGDAFSTIYTELPRYLTVSHDTIITPGQTSFNISADENALICLTVNSEIIAVETGTGLPLDIIIPPLSEGDTILVTVTKQNYYRYSKAVSVQSPNGIDENEDIRVVNFALYQNYPNPFNPVTSINFSIPDESIVNLKIFNVLGKQILTLVNENLSKGNYIVEFNASELPSGIYFYRLQAGSFVETKKMTLMK
ncbi:MAG: C25 family cysteine peptidase [Ignavibacteriaceae bacterium]